MGGIGKETTTTPAWFSQPVPKKEKKQKKSQYLVYLFLSVKPLAIRLHHAFSIFVCFAHFSNYWVLIYLPPVSLFLSCSAWHLSTRTTLISRHLTRKEENQRKEKKRKHRFVVVQFGREKGNKQTNKNSNFHRTDGWTSGQANETNEKVDVGDALFFFSTSVGKSMAWIRSLF